MEFARQAGYERVRLWTNHPLAAARHLYLERGFRLIAEEPHHSSGVDLVGQTYELDLASGAGGVGSGLSLKPPGDVDEAAPASSPGR